MIAPPARARCDDMKGTFQKKAVARTGKLLKVIEDSALACRPCRFFQDDPDVYYCDLEREEFPGLCERYQQRGNSPDMRLELMREMQDEL